MASGSAHFPVFPTLARIDSSDLRFVIFLAGLAAYGVGSSPTPDAIGGAEIFAGGALIIAAGGWNAVSVLWRTVNRGWERAARNLLLYGLTIPVLGGIAAGHGSGAMIRDIIAFLFLLLPLFMSGLCARKDVYTRPLIFFTLLIGILFSLRVLEPVFAPQTGPVWYIQPPADPFYLANAPTVLFAAMLLAGLAAKTVYETTALRRLLFAGCCALLSFFPLAAMMLITQRASMGVIVLATAALAAIGFAKNPRRAVMPLLMLAVAAWAGWDAIAFIGREAAQKTAAVGLNMRWAEAMAVMNELSGAPLAVLFGKGWGATVASPAVGGVTVNFTHSLITTYWLKTGLAGLSLALVYFVHMGLILLRMLRRWPVYALALAGPLAIDTLLYASFKSLDFGLILLAVVILGINLHRTKPQRFAPT